MYYSRTIKESVFNLICNNNVETSTTKVKVMHSIDKPVKIKPKQSSF